MDLRKVLFLGGNIRLASVQIRCVDIAKALGCDHLLNVHQVSAIPDRYSAFVCVKPVFPRTYLAELSRRGPVVWDIIDSPPPEEHVARYLASTQTAKELFADYGRIKVIPHHHCNFEGPPNGPDLRRPAWIGSQHWLPKLPGVDFDVYDVKGMRRKDVVQAHRKIGIGLNFRTSQPGIFTRRQRKLRYRFHVVINSGIKLINCLGFGTPSVSADEPAYHEIGEECTIISSTRKCAHWVHELQHDDELYLEIRKKCLRKAAKYHLNAIVDKYRKMLLALK